MAFYKIIRVTRRHFIADHPIFLLKIEKYILQIDLPYCYLTYHMYTTRPAVIMYGPYSMALMNQES